MRVKDDPVYTTAHDWQHIQDICEDFNQAPELITQHVRPKQRAAAYLGTIDPHKPLSKTELRQLLSKAQKLKKSTKKGERARGIELEKQLQCAFNLHR